MYTKDMMGRTKGLVIPFSVIVVSVIVVLVLLLISRRNISSPSMVKNVSFCEIDASATAFSESEIVFVSCGGFF